MKHNCPSLQSADAFKKCIPGGDSLNGPLSTIGLVISAVWIMRIGLFVADNESYGPYF